VVSNIPVEVLIGPSSRVAVQFGCLIPDERSGKPRGYVETPEMLENFESV
jgi:hypothetical protein